MEPRASTSTNSSRSLPWPEGTLPSLLLLLPCFPRAEPQWNKRQRETRWRPISFPSETWYHADRGQTGRIGSLVAAAMSQHAGLRESTTNNQHLSRPDRQQGAFAARQVTHCPPELRRKAGQLHWALHHGAASQALAPRADKQRRIAQLQ